MILDRDWLRSASLVVAQSSSNMVEVSSLGLLSSTLKVGRSEGPGLDPPG